MKARTGLWEANGTIGDGEAKDKEASGGTVPETSTVQEQLSDEDYYVVRKGDTLDSISVKVYGDDLSCRGAHVK